MQKCIVPLNREELDCYEDILKGVNNTGYNVEEVVYDVAHRVGKNPYTFGLYNPKILLLDEVYHAIWTCDDSAD